MKKLLAILSLLLLLSCQPLLCTSQDFSEKQELAQIIQELKNLNEEQAQIIKRSQIRNEELEKVSREQEQEIAKLSELSENRQKIINEQKQTINALQSSSKEQKKSLSLSWLQHVLTAIGCLLGGFFGGFFIGRVIGG